MPTGKWDIVGNYIYFECGYSHGVVSFDDFTVKSDWTKTYKRDNGRIFEGTSETVQKFVSELVSKLYEQYPQANENYVRDIIAEQLVERDPDYIQAKQNLEMANTNLNNAPTQILRDAEVEPYNNAFRIMGETRTARLNEIKQLVNVNEQLITAVETQQSEIRRSLFKEHIVKWFKQCKNITRKNQDDFESYNRYCYMRSSGSIK